MQGRRLGGTTAFPLPELLYSLSRALPWLSSSEIVQVLGVERSVVQNILPQADSKLHSAELLQASLND